MNGAEPRVALVTAGARRLGKAACLKLASLGYDIALHFNSSQKDAEETANLIKETGRECQLFQADLLQTSATESLIAKVLQQMNGLSVLVNNASTWVPSSFQESSAQELLDNIGIHLTAPYLLSRDFSKQCKHGQIINIIDANVGKDATHFFPYLLSKKSLYNLTMMLAVELAPNFRINAIAPGGFLPPEGAAASKSTDPLEYNLLRRKGQISDYTDALEYLLQSPHITGQCLYVAAGDQLQFEPSALIPKKESTSESELLKSLLQQRS